MAPEDLLRDQPHSSPALYGGDSAARTRIRLSTYSGGTQVSSTPAKLKHQLSPVEMETTCYYRANLALDINLVVLDTVEHLIGTFAQDITVDSEVAQRTFGLLMTSLRLGPCEALVEPLFATLRAFTSRFRDLIFHPAGEYCQILSLEVRSEV